ncbi:hypothetical protein CRENBAI_015920 [Crenichthys baileyi]|uniref:Uncharacterized protein n=1 Tax=Crenichthys baileyi TaxID=28760 RepID=A0AAV9SPU2_9TELE
MRLPSSYLHFGPTTNTTMTVGTSLLHTESDPLQFFPDVLSYLNFLTSPPSPSQALFLTHRNFVRVIHPSCSGFAGATQAYSGSSQTVPFATSRCRISGWVFLLPWTSSSSEGSWHREGSGGRLLCFHGGSTRHGFLAAAFPGVGGWTPSALCRSPVAGAASSFNMGSGKSGCYAG